MGSSAEQSIIPLHKLLNVYKFTWKEILVQLYDLLIFRYVYLPEGTVVGFSMGYLKIKRHSLKIAPL